VRTATGDVAEQPVPGGRCTAPLDLGTRSRDGCAPGLQGLYS